MSHIAPRAASVSVIPQTSLQGEITRLGQPASQFTYIFFFMPFFLKFLGFLPAVIVSSFVQILTERVPFLLIIKVFVSRGFGVSGLCWAEVTLGTDIAG